MLDGQVLPGTATYTGTNVVQVTAVETAAKRSGRVRQASTSSPTATPSLAGKANRTLARTRPAMRCIGGGISASPVQATAAPASPELPKQGTCGPSGSEPETSGLRLSASSNAMAA